jgi:Kef-type K+ transport system membrane component KefB
VGAFIAGLVLRRWAPGDVHALEGKLDAIGYGFFIPLFFVASGMTLDVPAILHAPARLLVFLVLLLLVRGLPSMVIYRRALDRRQRVEMTLLTATSLPLLVALAEIGLANGTMLPANAAALVGAGALSVLLYPTTAVFLHKRRPDATATADSAALSRSGAGSSATSGVPETS